MRVAALLILLTLFPGEDGFAATLFVKPTSSGTGSGNSWTNALGASFTPARGNTYYLADGSYGTKSWSTATSGTTLITIIKATVADHGGNEDGWVDTMGDDVATWSSSSGFVWDVDTDYWVFDGNGTHTTPSSTSTNYGFRVNSSDSDGNGGAVQGAAGVDHLTFRYMEMNSVVVGGDEGNLTNVMYFNPTCGGNITVEYSYLHDHNWHAMVYLNGCNTITFQYNYYKNAFKKEMHVLRNVSDFTYRWNIAENVAGTGWFVTEPTTNNIHIYGNVFYITDNTYTTTNCFLCNFQGFGYDASNVFVYNNTFYNNTATFEVGFDNPTNINFANNLIYAPQVAFSFYDTVTHDYNWCYSTVSARCSAIAAETNDQVGTGDPFVSVGSDWHLSAATTAGQTLSSPYNMDMYGNTRGADGTWDRGAIEYVAGGGGGGSVVMFIEALGAVSMVMQTLFIMGYFWERRRATVQSAIRFWRYAVECPSPKEMFWAFRYRRAVSRWQAHAPIMLEDRRTVVLQPPADRLAKAEQER